METQQKKVGAFNALFAVGALLGLKKWESGRYLAIVMGNPKMIPVLFRYKYYQFTSNRDQPVYFWPGRVAQTHLAKSMSPQET